jgi:hypothetical protein
MDPDAGCQDDQDDSGTQDGGDTDDEDQDGETRDEDGEEDELQEPINDAGVPRCISCAGRSLKGLVIFVPLSIYGCRLVVQGQCSTTALISDSMGIV